MIIGAQGYTIRDFAKSPTDVKQSFQRLSHIGFHAVQVSAFGEIDPKLLKEYADTYGLQIVLTHTNQERLLTDLATVIKEHEILSCKDIGVGMMPQRYQGSLEGAQAFIKDYTPIAEELSKCGIRFHYHNHGFEFQKFGSTSIFDTLIQETDPTIWSFILDVYWVWVAGHQPESLLKQLRGRIKFCHLKDLRIQGFEQQTAAVGDGNLNWDSILEACQSSGISYGLIEQDHTYGKYPFDELNRSLSYLQNHGLHA